MEREIRRLKRWSLVFSCLLLALCVRISFLQAEEDKIEQCIIYFDEIITIQKFREMLRIGTDEMLRRYKTGHITKEELDTTLRVWYSTESELKQKVAKLYDTAYAEKCFEDESIRTERRNAP